MKSLLLAIALAAASASAASAQPKPNTCRGTLMKLDSGDVVIGSPHEEGICTFDDADDAKKIMAVCRIGQHCEATGLVEDCKDSGECVTVSHVTNVTTAARHAEAYKYMCRVPSAHKSYPIAVNIDDATLTWRGTTFQNLRQGDGCRIKFLATSDSGVTAELCTATKGVADLKIGAASFDCQLAP